MTVEEVVNASLLGPIMGSQKALLPHCKHFPITPGYKCTDKPSMCSALSIGGHWWAFVASLVFLECCFVTPEVMFRHQEARCGIGLYLLDWAVNVCILHA